MGFGGEVVVHEDDVVLCCEGSRALEELGRLKNWGCLGLRTGWRTDVVVGLGAIDIVHRAAGTLGERGEDI